MVSLRCNTCVHFNQGFCNKLGEILPNRLAKLFFGGADGLYAGTVSYASECGIEKQPTQKMLELVVLIPENEWNEPMEIVKLWQDENES